MGTDMRSLEIGFVCVALAVLSGCLGHNEPCSSRPTDPLCQDTDGGPRPDGGSDGGGGDAHVACGGPCSAPHPHCDTASDTCSESCKLSGSICENAAKICDIAKQLGGTDAYANDKCASGNASCDASHAKCCSCQL